MTTEQKLTHAYIRNLQLQLTNVRIMRAQIGTLRKIDARYKMRITEMAHTLASESHSFAATASQVLTKQDEQWPEQI